MLKITLDSASLLYNFDYLSTKWDDIWPCVKKDSYWVWLKNILGILDRFRKINGVCTDSINDLSYIREIFSGTVLYFWEISETTIKTCKIYGAIPSIYLNEQIELLWNLFTDVFIELNCWLNRYWSNIDTIWSLIYNLKKSKIRISWIFTHFSKQNKQDFQKNLGYYKCISNLAKRHWISNISCLSTETSCRYSLFPQNIIRPGIWLYWYFSSSDNQDEKLKNILEISSHIASIRNILKWENIWYWSKYLVDSKSKIAIIPVWYADWIPKISELIWFVVICWNKCKILSVSMSCIFVDITNTEILLSDKVEILSKNISLYQWASWCNTIPQEILSWFCRGKGVSVNII